MFDINAALAKGTLLIQSYGQGGFTVADTRYDSAIFMHGGHITPVSLSHADVINPSHLKSLLPSGTVPEAWLIGTGEGHHFMPPAQRMALKAALGITPETMATGAACRTYNVLISEGRNVAALLFPI